MSEPLRVCLVSSSLHPVPLRSHGAAEVQMLEHARGLSSRGHEVHVLTVGESEEMVAETRKGITYHRLGAAFEGGDRRGVGGLPRSQAQFGLRARRLYRQLGPDIVHWHSRYPCLVGVSDRFGRRRGPCHIYHAHNWKLAERMTYRRFSPRRAAAMLGARAEKWLARRCDHIISISEFIRARVVESTGLPETRVSTVTNVVDMAVFHPDPAIERRQEILFVGRVAAEKGVAELIDAMAAVARERPDATLTIVGPEADGTERGSYLRSCTQLLDRHGLGDRIRFTGAVPNHELPGLLRRARVAAVPSIWGEPLGVVVLEALACGTPVVANRVGGIPELVDEGRNGMLASPGDPESLARCLTSALTDDALLRSAAEEGPRLVARRHTWNAIADRLETVYRGAMKDRASGERSWNARDV